MWVGPRALQTIWWCLGAWRSCCLTALPISLPLCSDDDRANLMWKRYLEREDSKIVGMEQGTATGKVSSRVWGGGCQLGRKKMILLRDVGASRGTKMWKRLGGLLEVVVWKREVRQRGGKRQSKQVSQLPAVTFSCLRFCLDLFVGQLKSCLKCQACGYRSTTFEVFCDLSLPIPKVGFQRIPGWMRHGFSDPTLPTPGVWEGALWVSGAELKLGLTEKSWKRKPRADPPFISLSLQKGFAGGKVSLRDCFSLFTKEEELESENAPVRVVQMGLSQ